jgi:hypothetical protein
LLQQCATLLHVYLTVFSNGVFSERTLQMKCLCNHQLFCYTTLCRRISDLGKGNLIVH